MNNHLKLQNLDCARILYISLHFFLGSLWPTFLLLRAYSISMHLVKSSGNSEMPGCGNIGGYCLKTREQEGAEDARLHLELFGSCTGRDPAPAKLGRKSPTSEVWCLDPLVQQPAASQCNCFLNDQICSSLGNMVEIAHFLKQCPFHKNLHSSSELEHNNKLNIVYLLSKLLLYWHLQYIWFYCILITFYWTNMCNSTKHTNHSKCYL